MFDNAHSEPVAHKYSRRAMGWYLAALLVMVCGLFIAAQYYPGGFDWLYTVASALASQKHNPTGSGWFAAGLSLSMLLLWQYVSALKQGLSYLLPSTRFAIVTLRVGLLFGILLGVERLLIHDLSHWIYKAHEAIALLTFLGLYIGTLVLLLQLLRRNKRLVWPVLLVLSPLVAIGINQLWLYLDQRDLGWVDTSWREKGIPFWLSFAFWQWLAIGFLWAGLGMLNIFVKKNNERR